MSLMRAAGVNVLATGAGETNTRTPDYHLTYTGPQVQALLDKINDLNLAGVGGTTTVESSKTNPANIDGLTDPGNYVIDYVSGSDYPEEIMGYHPVNLSVYTDPDGNLIQVIEAGGIKYYRVSNDGGNTWSVWILKSTNGPDIVDPSGGSGVTEPPTDPIQEIKDDVKAVDKKVDDLSKAIGDVSKAALTLGTEAVATAIMAGKYDYDTGKIVS